MWKSIKEFHLVLAKNGRKTCSACRGDLPVESFNKNKSAKDGLQNQCHDCMKETRRRWREANPELHQARHIRNRYGITLDAYNALAEATGGLCPVCRQPPPPPFRVLDLDHDHATGVVRGFLCRGCNLALGGACDDPSILRALADYVEDHKANPREFEAPKLPTNYVMGESHHQSVLTADQVREIRTFRAAGEAQSVIAERFGVTQQLVSMICRRKIWQHLPD